LSRPLLAARATTLRHALAPIATARRNTSASVWANAESCSLSLHVQAVDVPKQWMSPTAERVWHRMKRLKDTEMRLWAEEESAKKNSPWRRFGLYPLIGLSTVAMISKEWMILLLGEYQFIPIATLVFSGIYVYGRGGVEEWFASGHAKKRGGDVEVYDWKIELTQEALTEHRANAQMIDLVHEFRNEHTQVRKELQNYYTMKPRHEYRDTVENQLKQIYQQEVTKATEEGNKIVKGSEAFVIGKIQADAAFRALAIQQAIDSVGTPSKLSPADPVVKIFNDYLKQFGKPGLKLTK